MLQLLGMVWINWVVGVGARHFFLTVLSSNTNMIASSLNDTMTVVVKKRQHHENDQVTKRQRRGEVAPEKESHIRLGEKFKKGEDVITILWKETKEGPNKMYFMVDTPDFGEIYSKLIKMAGLAAATKDKTLIAQTKGMELLVMRYLLPQSPQSPLDNPHLPVACEFFSISLEKLAEHQFISFKQLTSEKDYPSGSSVIFHGIKQVLHYESYI